MGIPVQAQPDVIVGELTGTQSYGSVGGIAAFSFGTTSCNIGTAPLSWVGSTNQHPVIGQNVFRLENGRFEQIGQAWLKHGFTALQQSVCGPCIANPNGSALGVGCSDPYSSSLNGQQTRLGPKSEVNPSTGFYPYPFTSPTYNSTIGRRLQIHHSDLDPTQHPDARYFAEGQYVTADDASAGMDDNNASYREIFVTQNGPGYSIAFRSGSSTQRTKPAIQAWQDLDPSVDIRTIDVPGDGRILLGTKVTPLPQGGFHCEYAVQNLNSHRGVSGFSVQLPAGATVSNLGFHDADYHSNEPSPYSLTDWNGTVLSNGVAWMTETFAQNPNANAIRWGTLYNFRFDSDQVPGGVTLELFRPGMPPSVTASPVLPPFAIVLPQGFPDRVDPGVATNVLVRAIELQGQVVPASGQLHVSVNGGAFSATPLVALGGSDYHATLPASAAFAHLTWYVTFQATSGATISEPLGAPATVHSTDAVPWALDVVFQDDMETNVPGWSVSNGPGLTDGAWDATPGVPAGLGQRGDPPAANGGSGRCFLTDNVFGNSDVDGGETRLSSPTFDLSGHADARIRVAIWYTNDFGNSNPNDSMLIQISNDGGQSWVTMETRSLSANAWIEHSYRVGQFVTPTAQMKVRFIASDVGQGHVVEAGIDDLVVEVAPSSPNLGPCSAGAVGAALGGPYDVLTVNGSGGGAARRVDVALNAPINVAMAAPPGSTSPATFLIYGTVGAPSPSDVFELPFGLGTFCFKPCVFAALDPNLFALVDGFGLFGCTPFLPGGTTPWNVDIPTGSPIPLTLTLQGLIADPSAATGFAVTNAVILRIN